VKQSNAHNDLRIVQLSLADAVVADADKHGERLRFGLPVDDKLVLVRFPVYAKWDRYVSDMNDLMLGIGFVAGNIELDPDAYSISEFQNWCEIMGLTLRSKRVQQKVEHIFYDYLRPIVQGLKIPPAPKRGAWRWKRKDPYETPETIEEKWAEDFTRHWLGNHMDFSHLYAMLQSILQVDRWLGEVNSRTLTGFVRLADEKAKSQSVRHSPPQKLPESPLMPESQPGSVLPRLSLVDSQPFTYTPPASVSTDSIEL
jgi:hypothetical protein